MCNNRWTGPLESLIFQRLSCVAARSSPGHHLTVRDRPETTEKPLKPKCFGGFFVLGLTPPVGIQRLFWRIRRRRQCQHKLNADTHGTFAMRRAAISLAKRAPQKGQNLGGHLGNVEAHEIRRRAADAEDIARREDDAFPQPALRQFGRIGGTR